MEKIKTGLLKFLQTRNLFVFCFIWILGGFTAPGSVSSNEPRFHRVPNESDRGSEPTALLTDEKNGDLAIGNNQVRFCFSKSGGWLGLFPSWMEGHSLFRSGGFFLLSADKDGRLRTMVATVAMEETAGDKAGPLSTGEDGSGHGRCWEGIKGGNRAPAPEPDDDNDNRIDEDRLDGVDNDGDGLVDEDFAAVGDEMIVAEYSSRAGRGRPALRFHQETYAWALSHIECMVMIRLIVENEGVESLENVRIGTFFEKEGPYVLSEEILSNRSNLLAEPEQARAVVCSDPREISVGLLLPSIPRKGAKQADWNLWASDANKPLEIIFEETAEAKAVGSNAREPGRNPEHLPAFEELGVSRVEAGKTAFTGGISPDLGDLAPGGAVEITIALFAVPKRDMLERTLVDAHRTYMGDGTHRFIPPPVPVTPVMMWGNYQWTQDPEPELLVTIERNPSRGFNKSRCIFIGGVDPADLEILPETFHGIELRIRGESAERLRKKVGERIILKGRNDTGTFFDAALDPAEGIISGHAAVFEDAEQYWDTPGKLSEDLLSGSPNPFREQTTLFFEVPAVLETEDGSEIRFFGSIETSLKVYDVTGRLVIILVDEIHGPGLYQIDWLAVDEGGNPVASGVYYIKLQIGKRYITKRLILLK